MLVDGKTRTCGLIGNPVEHTLSPVIHNNLAERTGVNLVYVPFSVEREGLSRAVKGAYELNLLGLNITVPYKNDILSSLVELDKEAEAIGAVNTLVRVSGGYKGYNTDILGLHRAMIQEGTVLRDQDVVILGAGGASKAAAYLCVREGARSVHLLNRTLIKAEEIAYGINKAFHTKVVIPGFLSDYKRLPSGKYLAIQTTSVGLSPNTDAAVIEDKEFYGRIHTAVDIIYNPWETKFMRMVRETGGTAYNGMKMLLYQGITAFELWNQINIDDETADRLYQLLESGCTADSL